MNFSFCKEENESEELSFSKKLIFTISIICCVCGLVWSYLYYIILGLCATTLFPLCFSLIVGFAILLSHYKSNYRILVCVQLLGITVFPSLVQWSFGAVHESGIVIYWSFLGPIGALLFLNRRQSIILMTAFILLAITFIGFEPKLMGYVVSMPEDWISFFKIMNLTMPSIIVFVTSLYFIGEIIRHKHLKEVLLKISKQKNKDIIDSIHYAKRIQKGIIPSKSSVKKLLPNSFTYFKAKNIVSGDFYWIKEKENTIYFAVADCTGHGVPGAFVSLICNNALNKSLYEFNLNEPGLILDKTRELIIEEFAKSEEDVKDGMDIALCALNGNSLKYAGAFNPLWIIREKEIIEIKADKQFIGNYEKENTPFTTHFFTLEKNDSIYIFSDGYVDQFGGEYGKKFKKHNFKNLLISIQDKDLEEQKTIIHENFLRWKKKLKQVDDICIIGLKHKTD